MTDVFIIGGGPAGVSAALYTTRAGLQTQLIYKDHGALAKAECVENFYGQVITPDGVSLVEAGLDQARQLGVDVLQGEVTGLTLDEFFTVETTGISYQSKTAILATGANRKSPDIPGLREFEGRGVSYCAVCDAFFYRGKDVAVLGSGGYAAQEAKALEELVHSVVQLNPDDVTEIIGENTVTAVRLKNGDSLPISGLFVAIGVAGGVELAKKIGAAVDKKGVVVDNELRTSVPGLWAAGDCVPGMKQIAKAVYDGAIAGMEIIKYLREVGHEERFFKTI